MTRAEKAAWEAYPSQVNPELDDLNGCYRTGFEVGYEQAEEDLLANAIDAEIVKDIHNLLHVKSAPLPMPSEFKFGDKVKIIILPDETDNR